MFKEITKDDYLNSVLTGDIVTVTNGITFVPGEEGNKRYAHHVLKRRNGRVVGKIISDMWGVEPTKYFKAAS